MSLPLTWRERFLVYALGGAIQAADGALEDRECENDRTTRCDLAGDELCWRCGHMAESIIASQILEAARYSATDRIYKVSVQVERTEINQGTESHKNIGLPDTLARLETLAEARAFVRTLPRWDPDSTEEKSEE